MSVDPIATLGRVAFNGFFTDPLQRAFSAFPAAARAGHTVRFSAAGALNHFPIKNWATASRAAIDITPGRVLHNTAGAAQSIEPSYRWRDYLLDAGEARGEFQGIARGRVVSSDVNGSRRNVGEKRMAALH